MTHHKINALHKHSLGPGFPKLDVEEGALNDDQLQALWGRTLYEALRTHDAIMVSEPDDDGLLQA